MIFNKGNMEISKYKIHRLAQHTVNMMVTYNHHQNTYCILSSMYFYSLSSKKMERRRRRRRSVVVMMRKLELGFVFLMMLFLSVHGAVDDVGEGSNNGKLTPALFIFGDSLVDDGNNNFIPSIARANYRPYGIDFGYPTGRFCNGLTLMDYGAHLLGLPLIPPYLNPNSKGTNILSGLNYASAAAGILDETGRHYGARASLSDQVMLFGKTVTMQLPELFERTEDVSQYLAQSVYYIGLGSNDYINNYLMPKIYTSSRMYNPEAFADLLARTLSKQITKLYGLGARKIVLGGTGPLGCIPSQLSMDNNGDNNGVCVKSINDMVVLYNDRLLQLSKTLNATLPGVFIVYHHNYDFVVSMIQNPSKYGFTVVNQACCGNGKYGGTLTCLPYEKPCVHRDKYIFWDSFHPTQAVNALIADRSFGKYPVDCYPIGIAELAKL